jgi:hypothetical protein
MIARFKLGYRLQNLAGMMNVIFYNLFNKVFLYKNIVFIASVHPCHRLFGSSCPDESRRSGIPELVLKRIIEHCKLALSADDAICLLIAHANASLCIINFRTKCLHLIMMPAMLQKQI